MVDDLRIAPYIPLVVPHGRINELMYRDDGIAQ